MITFKINSFLLYRVHCPVYICFVAKKIFLAFRLTPELRMEIEEIANSEERSISQVCELFLRGGVEAYKKEGAQYLQRLLTKQKARNK